MAGNLARAAGDGAENARRRNHLVVEHDGEGPPDIGRGHLAELLAAANIEAEIDHRLAIARVEARRGVGQVLALHHHLLFDRQFARLVGLFEHVDIAGIGAGIGDEAEFQLRRGADDFLQAVGVLQARHFDQHAVIALALDVGLGGAEAVDAAVEHFDGLLDGALDLVVDGGVGDGEFQQAVAGVGNVEAGAAGGGKRHQAGELRHDAGAVVGVGDANLNATRVDADAAGNADFFLAQQPAQIVAQIADHAADHVGAVHFIEQMRAALQIEAEHDGFRLQPRRHNRGESGAVLRADHAGKADHESDQRRGEGQGGFPEGEAHHDR